MAAEQKVGITATSLEKFREMITEFDRLNGKTTMRNYDYEDKVGLTATDLNKLREMITEFERLKR